MPRNPKTKNKKNTVPDSTPAPLNTPHAPHQKPIAGLKAKTPQGVRAGGSTAVKPLDFLVKCLITVNARNAAGIEEKRMFPQVFELDADGAEKPWYVLRNFYVPQFLKATVGPEGIGYTKIYEIKIEKMVNRHNPAEVDDIPLRVMTMDQLEAYAKMWQYPVKPSDYHTVVKAREMVLLYEEDPLGFDIQHRAYVAGLGRKNPEMDKYRQGIPATKSSEDLMSEFDGLAKADLNPAVRTGIPSGPISAEEQAMLDTPEELAQETNGDDSNIQTPTPGYEPQTVPTGKLKPAVKDPFAAV